MPNSQDHSNEVFRTEGVRVIATPIRAPNANDFAERWVATVPAECLDWVLVLGRRHLQRVHATYVKHYNEQRPHRARELRPPARPPASPGSDPRTGRVGRRDLLGGLIHEYEVAA
ncbi:MAG TPA: integrase core domain-containing protein [Actinomycetota bacterium]